MADCTCADPQLVAQAIDKHAETVEQVTVGEGSIDETLFGKNQPVDEAAGDEPGEHGNIARIRFCHWAAPQWGPVGENKWTMAFQAAQLAIAILNSVIQGQIADMQQDLADGYYQQAKYKWDRFADKYQPLEKDILWEAQSEPIKELNCDDDRRRAAQAVNPAFDLLTRYAAQLAKSYRLCPDETVTGQLLHTRSQVLVDTENYNLLDDQWFSDYRNDRRWNRRSNILNLGRNLGSTAMQYGDTARKLMSDVGNLVNKVAGSLSQALGYYGSRFDTFYPTTYLSGTSQSLVTTNYHGMSYSPSGATSTLG